jgi:hypothetical protein
MNEPLGVGSPRRLARLRTPGETKPDDRTERGPDRRDDDHGRQAAQIGFRPEPVTRDVGGRIVEEDKTYTQADRDAAEPAHRT